MLFAEVAVFFGVVGLGQMLLFKGGRPRRASMIAGAGFGVGLSITSWVVRNALGPSFIVFIVEPLLCGLAAYTPILAKVAATRSGWPAGLAYFLGLLVSCVLVVLIYLFMPAIPE